VATSTVGFSTGTVLICTYNCEQLLGKTLECLPSVRRSSLDVAGNFILTPVGVAPRSSDRNKRNSFAVLDIGAYAACIEH